MLQWVCCVDLFENGFVFGWNCWSTSRSEIIPIALFKEAGSKVEQVGHCCGPFKGHFCSFILLPFSWILGCFPVFSFFLISTNIWYNSLYLTFLKKDLNTSLKIMCLAQRSYEKCGWQEKSIIMKELLMLFLGYYKTNKGFWYKSTSPSGIIIRHLFKSFYNGEEYL